MARDFQDFMDDYRNADYISHADYRRERFRQYPYKSKAVAALLCLFLGMLGIHRFYVGKVGTGILWFLTMGWCGIGVLIDLVLILAGSFRDKAGYPLI